jgi:hypothetical protein
MGKFEELYQLNVNDKTEKKGNLTYLSWSYAWAEFKKAYPKATYTVDKFNGTYCTGNEQIGYMVRTEVFADELNYEMWLPVMDNKNKTILKPQMTDVNKAIMRCLTKNLAMFGLGLYIYAGEDLPENESVDQEQVEEKQPKKEPKKQVKTEEKKEPFNPITKSELVQIWGVKNAEATVTWLEGRFGCELSNFDEDQAKYARQLLAEKKKKREDEELRQRTLEKISVEDLPFELGETVE